MTEQVKRYDPEVRFNQIYKAGYPVLSHYEKHVFAMTHEHLDAKSEIATELAWRDWQIEQLDAICAEHEALIEQMHQKVVELKSKQHINEIKARGIEAAIAHVKGLDKRGSTKVLLAIQATINRLQEYAQQLRKGGDDE